MKAVHALIKQEIREELFIQTNREALDRLLDQMNASTKSLRKPGTVCLDPFEDVFRLVLLGATDDAGFLTDIWAGSRHFLEGQFRTEYDKLAAQFGGPETMSLIKQSVNPWGYFFPPDFHFGQLNREVVAAFEAWSRRRRALLDDRISICMFPYFAQKGYAAPNNLSLLTLRYWNEFIRTRGADKSSQWKKVADRYSGSLLLIDSRRGSYRKFQHFGYLFENGLFGDQPGDSALLEIEQSGHWLKVDLRIKGVELFPEEKLAIARFERIGTTRTKVAGK